MQKSSLKRRSVSFPDLGDYKALRSNSNPNLTVPRNSGSPWLTLFLDDGDCVLYNPEERKIEKKLGNFSGTRILTNYGNWFLVLDSRSDLYIIDVFSNKRIDLPPLESLLSSTAALKRVEDTIFRWEFTDGSYSSLRTDVIRGRLWVDDKTEEYVVAWFLDCPGGHLSFCKKGNDHYTAIPLRDDEVPKLYKGLHDLVIQGYRLYISTTRGFVRVIDLSGHHGFKDVTPLGYTYDFNIAVTTAGEVLLVESITFESHRSFRLYKKDPNADPDDYSPDLLEVDSLGDEALFLDFGITVPANHTLGIEPNSIYFTRQDRALLYLAYDLDVCVFNLATKTLKRFPALSNMNIKDATWFLPMT